MRRSITATLVPLAAVFALVTGCGDADDGGSTTTPTDPRPPSTEPGGGPSTTPGETGETGETGVPEALVGRTWQLAALGNVAGPQPVPPDVDSTLTFHPDGTVDLRSGCNTGSGEATFDGGTVSVTVTATKMACDDDTMQIEGATLGVLDSPMSWSVGGDTLSLIPTNVSDSGLYYHDVSSVPDTTADASPADDRAGRLAAVAANRVSNDNSFGGADPQETFGAIGIVDALATVSGDGDAEIGEDPPRLSAEEQAAIEEALAPVSVRWIEPGQKAAVTERIMNQDGRLGALVTLAEPEPARDVPTAYSELYCGGTCGIGGANEMERQPDGTWTVGAPVGPQWIS